MSADNTKALPPLPERAKKLALFLEGVFVSEELSAVKAREIAKCLRELCAALAQRQQVPLTSAAADVLAERKRQMDVEGWTPEHDDKHKPGELSDAAACYAAWGGPPSVSSIGLPPPIWPWDCRDWKPSTTRRDLVKAAALLLAEIERIDRSDG